MSALSQSAQHLTVDPEAMAQEAYASRPHPSSMWDDRLYRTHAPVLVRAVNADDILADSNYETALATLTAVSTVWQLNEDGDARVCLEDRTDVFAAEMRNQGQDCECESCSPSVIDARISDWAWGPVDQLFVRTHWTNPDGSRGEITNVWREACAIIEALRDYPVLDDNDYSEREWASFEDAYSEALNSVENYPPIGDDDSDQDRAAILALVKSDREFRDDGNYFDAWRESSLTEVVEERYQFHREAYFEARALDAQFIGDAAQMPGQQSL